MKRRALDRLVGQAHARAQLVRILVLPHLIEPRAGIESEIVGEPPFVLEVDAAKPPQQHAGVDRRERYIGQDLRACRSVDRQKLRGIGNSRLLGARKYTGSQRMRLVDVKGAVALDAVDNAAAEHLARYSIEHEIRDGVGRELNHAGAREIGELQIDVVRPISAGPARRTCSWSF